MSTKTLTEEALEGIHEALLRGAMALEDLGTAFETLITAGSPPPPHVHTWVFLRTQNTIRKADPELGKRLLGEHDPFRTSIDRYTRVCDLYYCSDCPELRSIHMEDYVHNPQSIDGQPHIRFWQKEIPEL